MSSLPQLTWDIDPVFLQVPRDLVIGIAGLVAVYSLIQGMRRKGSDHYTTAGLFGVLAFIAWKYMGEGLELRYYSLLFVGVFLGGYALLKWQIVRGGGPEQDAGDFIVYGVLGVLLGARLGHVIFYDLDKALRDPAWVFKIWTGGLASHGAVLGLIAAMFLFTKRRGIPFLEGADRFAFSAALGATLVRVGNLMNSEIVGREVPGQTWGFRFPRFDHNLEIAPLRYPTQLYEVTLGLVVLGSLYLIDRRLGREKRPRAVLISSFFAIYFSGRFFIEFYKEFEGPITSGSPLTMGQVLSLPGVLLGIYGLYWAFKRKLPAGWPYGPEEEVEEEADERPARKRRVRDEEEEDDTDGEDDTDRPRAKARGGKAAPSKQAAAGASSAKDKDDDDRRSDADDDDDDEDDDDRRSDADDDEDDDDRRNDADDDDEDDDDEDEEGERDDDDEDDDDDRKPAVKGGKQPSVDPDVADEFDDKGSLKRRR